MNKVIRGKAFVLGDNIDTDQIIPAGWLKLSTTNPEERKLYGKYAMSGVPEGQSGLPAAGYVPLPDAFKQRLLASVSAIQ